MQGSARRLDVAVAEHHLHNGGGLNINCYSIMNRSLATILTYSHDWFKKKKRFHKTLLYLQKLRKATGIVPHLQTAPCIWWSRPNETALGCADPYTHSLPDPGWRQSEASLPTVKCSQMHQDFSVFKLHPWFYRFPRTAHLSIPFPYPFLQVFMKNATIQVLSRLSISHPGRHQLVHLGDPFHDTHQGLLGNPWNWNGFVQCGLSEYLENKIK